MTLHFIVSTFALHEVESKRHHNFVKMWCQSENESLAKFFDFYFFVVRCILFDTNCFAQIDLS